MNKMIKFSFLFTFYILPLCMQSQNNIKEIQIIIFASTGDRPGQISIEEFQLNTDKLDTINFQGEIYNDFFFSLISNLKDTLIWGKYELNEFDHKGAILIKTRDDLINIYYFNTYGNLFKFNESFFYDKNGLFRKTFERLLLL